MDEMTREIQKHIDQVMNEYNNTGKPEFEGYSPVEMQFLLYGTFGERSPVQLLDLAGSDVDKVPILNLVKCITGIIGEHGELKLTNKGYLPTRIVAKVHNHGF